MEEQTRKGDPVEPLELKAKYLDPLVEIINVHGIPRDTQTLVLLVTTLALFPSEHQMSLKFMKQWSKKLDATLPPDQRSLLTQSVCYFKLASHPSVDTFLKDTRLHDLLLDHFLEPTYLPLFFTFWGALLTRSPYVYLFLLLAALEVKLGFLVDDHITPQSLVFDPADLAMVQTRPELGRLIVDKLSKVKGKKVRKAVVEAARGVLEG